MVYKNIFFILSIFFYLVNIWGPGNAMPSESITAKSQKRNTYEEHMYKAPNEKDSPEIFQYNNEKMLPVANTSLHNKDSPIIYLNTNKFHIRQYKVSNLTKTEKEIIYDEIGIRDILNINGALDKSKPNIKISDSKHDGDTQSYQETIGNISRRLLASSLDRLLPLNTQASTKNSSSNETRQLPTISIHRNNDPTNYDSDIIERNETNFRRMFDTKHIVDNEEGQDLQDLDVTELSVAVTNHPKLCYVCNSIYEPSCWSPGRKTHVKYCREQHQSCLTHLYIHDGARYVVRDCGSTCISTTSGKNSKSFVSCTVCYTDLCNNANYLKAQNFIFLILILLKL